MYDKHNMELLAILKQESKHNPELETYCSAFEDPYGDQYDWDEESVTQHYVCWMLNAHYNQQVIVRAVWSIVNSYYWDISKSYTLEAGGALAGLG